MTTSQANHPEPTDIGILVEAPALHTEGADSSQSRDGHPDENLAYTDPRLPATDKHLTVSNGLDGADERGRSEFRPNDAPGELLAKGSHLDTDKLLPPFLRGLANQRSLAAMIDFDEIWELIAHPANSGVSFPRNRMIDYCREHDLSGLALLADSDVAFHEEMAQMMQDRLHRHPDCGIVGFEQANQGFPVDDDGYVHEIANECQLTRISMWREIGLYTEAVSGHGAESWKSVIANMHGWRTVVIKGPPGYTHYKHGSTTTPGVLTTRESDTRKWTEVWGRFVKYWRNTLVMGKGEECRLAPSRINVDSDENVREERFDRDVRGLEIYAPASSGFRFTNQRDLKALVWLSRKVAGNILEIGCHEGITAMQFAINSPEKLVVGVDYSGPDHTMIPEQASEQPKPEQVGMHLRNFRNGQVIDDRIDRIILHELPDIDFVFYDAALHYEGVKEITEQVLAFWTLHPKNRTRILALHDYVRKSSHRYPGGYAAKTDRENTVLDPTAVRVSATTRRKGLK